MILYLSSSLARVSEEEGFLRLMKGATVGSGNLSAVCSVQCWTYSEDLVHQDLE